MQPEFWRGKRVLVTGHTGFKGSWLSLWLQSVGAEVIGYSLPTPTTPSLYEAARVAKGMTSIHGDVRELDPLVETIKKERPEIVFHLAAQPLVRLSYEHPVETFMTNAIGTANVLEATRTTEGVRAAVMITTDKCYENKEWVWGYREHEPLGGHDPYSSSKACAELVTAAYRSSYFSKSGVAVASARAGNVIGGGDWAADRLVPDIMKAAEKNISVAIRNPAAVRPWQHVLEPLHGYLMLAEKLWDEGQKYAEPWNFGPRESDFATVGEVTEKLIRLWGDGACWEAVPSTGPHEAHLLMLDSAKARTQLGWIPKLNLAACLEWVVRWYKANKGGEDMRKVTTAQIADYQVLATHSLQSSGID
jgi:CDP-glucose 4,6-dehydratase